MKITAEPRSDQLNGVDFIAGPRVFTIAGASHGKAEAKYDISLVGETRCWRPPLTVLRLVMFAWGDETDEWIGRRVELFRDDTVTFGKDKVGGVRLSAMSHITKPLTVVLPSSKNKQDVHKVMPLPDAQPVDIQPHLDAISNADSIDTLIAAWNTAGQARITSDPQVIAAKDKRKAELTVKNDEAQEVAQ